MRVLFSVYSLPYYLVLLLLHLHIVAVVACRENRFRGSYNEFKYSLFSHSKVLILHIVIISILCVFSTSLHPTFMLRIHRIRICKIPVGLNNEKKSVCIIHFDHKRLSLTNYWVSPAITNSIMSQIKQQWFWWGFPKWLPFFLAFFNYFRSIVACYITFSTFLPPWPLCSP